MRLIKVRVKLPEAVEDRLIMPINRKRGTVKLLEKRFERFKEVRSWAGSSPSWVGEGGARELLGFFRSDTVRSDIYTDACDQRVERRRVS